MSRLPLRDTGLSRQHPRNEMNSPSGLGSVGLNGSKEYVLDVLNPAAVAALRSTKGNSAATAWSILVQHSVLS